MDKIKIDDCPIGNIRIEKELNKYSISVRIGEYYEFDYSKISNEHHQHDCYELVLVLHGRGTFFYEGKDLLLKEGALFISEPDREHEIHINKNDKMTLLYIFFKIKKKQKKRSLSYEERILDQFLIEHRNIVENQKQLFSYIVFFEEYINNRGSKHDFWFLSSLEDFLFYCLELLGKQKPDHQGIENPSGDLFENALDYIDKNLSKKITADDISASIHTSKRNLYRMFNKHMNRSVNDYVNEKKISLAENYLKMNMSVTDSASLVGFDNLSQFNKLFHKYMEMSPREYKSRSQTQPEGYGRRHKV